MLPSPMPLDLDTANGLTETNIAEVKRLDCSFYNDCLDQAYDGNWPGFGCTNCKAYQALDGDQRQLDVQNLLMVRKAAKNVEMSCRKGKDGEEIIGSAKRKRGVKEGVDAKVKRRLPVLIERCEASDTNVLRALVLG